MEFEVVMSFWVEDADLVEMARLVIEDDYDVDQAIEEVASGWDDDPYYLYSYALKEIRSAVMTKVEEMKNAG